MRRKMLCSDRTAWKGAKSAIALVALLPLGACENGVTGPAHQAETSEAPGFAVLNQGRFPFSAPGFLVCGELVDFSGEFHTKVSQTVTPNGIHFTYHINAVGTGVGRSSGATYRWNDNINQAHNDSLLPLTVNAVQTWKLISLGKDPNFVLKQRFHVTINANGEMTVLHQGLEVECK